MLSGIGFGELAVICIVLIFAVGPDRLPAMMRTLGKTVRSLRQASRDIRSATGIDEMMRDDVFDLRAQVRPPAPPTGPAPVSREQSPAPLAGDSAAAATAVPAEDAPPDQVGEPPAERR